MTRRLRISGRVRFFAAAAGSLLLAAIFLAPLLSDTHPPAAALIYAMFSPHCHQIPERCFHVSGHPLAVCARCLGVYFGFLLGVLIHPLTTWSRRDVLPPPAVMAVLSLPMAVDYTGNLFRLWTSSHALRLATGGVWGLVLAWFFIPGATEAVLKLTSKRLHPPWEKT